MFIVCAFDQQPEDFYMARCGGGKRCTHSLIELFINNWGGISANALFPVKRHHRHRTER